MSIVEKIVTKEEIAKNHIFKYCLLQIRPKTSSCGKRLKYVYVSYTHMTPIFRTFLLIDVDLENAKMSYQVVGYTLNIQIKNTLNLNTE